jgi:invasion protein IalB
MRSVLVTAALLGALAGVPVLAQDATAPAADAATPAPAPGATETPPEAPAESADAPASEAAPESSAEATAAAPAPRQPPTSRDQVGFGEAYIRDQFADWMVRCIKLDQQDDLCEMHQPLNDPDGTRTAEFNLFPLERGQIAAGGTIVSPLETILTEGVRLSIDGGEVKVYPFTFCNRVGCVAQVGFLETELNQFRRGRTSVIQIVPLAAPDQTVLLTVSLSGFTAAYASLLP